MRDNETNRLARYTRFQALTLSVVAAMFLTPVVLAVLVFVFMIVWPMRFTRIRPEFTFPVIGCLAIALACVSARLIYMRLRWHRPFETSQSFGLLTLGDWGMSVVNFVGLLFALAIIARMLGMQGARSGEIALGVLAPVLSAANAYLYLRGRVRKRSAAVMAKLIREGRVCSCGYDLTGNVSGVCPECGHPVRRRLGTADSVDAKRAES